jgi:hypothetical protein
MHENLSWSQRLGVSLLDSIIPHNYQPHAVGMLLVQYFATVGVFSLAQHCALMVPAKDPRSLHPVPQQGSVQRLAAPPAGAATGTSRRVGDMRAAHQLIVGWAFQLSDWDSGHRWSPVRT